MLNGLYKTILIDFDTRYYCQYVRMLVIKLTDGVYINMQTYYYKHTNHYNIAAGPFDG